MCENGVEPECVDPRVQVELERLNTATDEINRLEVELSETRNAFRLLLCDSTSKVDALRHKLGLCVERAKPYYEARFCASEALKQTQRAAMKYEKANSAHSAAREMVYLAEQGLGGRTLDPAWQEMLNHATQRVNESEKDREEAATEHRIACVKHEAACVKVQSLQKELKRAINKSSLSIRRALLTLSSLESQHNLLFLPYYEMKAHFNTLLEQQKQKINNNELQVQSYKWTYADALRNLEQISDEIHRTRKRAVQCVSNAKPAPTKQISLDSNESFLEDAQEFVDQYKGLPEKLARTPATLNVNMEEVEGYRNVRLGNNLSPQSSSSDKAEREGGAVRSHSAEWTEINLDASSPEDDIGYKRLEDFDENKEVNTECTTSSNGGNDYSLIKNKLKLETNISNWISRSSAKTEESQNDRRQSLDNILGPTSERMKEIFSQGMMMFNISSLTERRNSEPKVPVSEEKPKVCSKKIPSPLEKTMTYLTAEEDNSDTDSVSSMDMLNEDQISSLMLDKELDTVCEQLLGTPIAEVVSVPPILHPARSSN